MNFVSAVLLTIAILDLSTIALNFLRMVKKKKNINTVPILFLIASMPYIQFGVSVWALLKIGNWLTVVGIILTLTNLVRVWKLFKIDTYQKEVVMNYVYLLTKAYLWYVFIISLKM